MKKEVIAFLKTWWETDMGIYLQVGSKKNNLLCFDSYDFKTETRNLYALPEIDDQVYEKIKHLLGDYRLENINEDFFKANKIKLY